MEGPYGNDLIDGGAGIDTVSFASSGHYVWISTLDANLAYDNRTGWLDGITNVQNVKIGASSTTSSPESTNSGAINGSILVNAVP